MSTERTLLYLPVRESVVNLVRTILEKWEIWKPYLYSLKTRGEEFGTGKRFFPGKILGDQVWSSFIKWHLRSVQPMNWYQQIIKIKDQPEVMQRTPWTWCRRLTERIKSKEERIAVREMERNPQQATTASKLIPSTLAKEDMIKALENPVSEVWLRNSNLAISSWKTTFSAWKPPTSTLTFIIRKRIHNPDLNRNEWKTESYLQSFQSSFSKHQTTGWYCQIQ